MSWRDRYQPGSFRGVAFVSLRHDHELGRRGSAHQFPERDTPWFEDLGRKGRNWSLSMFVIGADYMEARDALIAAFEAKGPGTLVHPWLGTFEAQATDVRLSESTDEGGMARFDVQFVEPGLAITANAAVDTGAVARAAADASDANATSRFTEEFQVSGKPPFVDDAAMDVLDQQAVAIGNAGTLLGGSGAARGAFVAALEGLSDATIVLGAAAALAAVVGVAVGALGSLGDRPDDQVAALRQLMAAATSLPPVRVTTASRSLQAANQQAVADLVLVVAASTAVRSAAATDFASYDDAVALRDALGDDLDKQALAAAARFNDALAADLDALRRAMIVDVTARGGSLARLFTYTPTAVTPALVLAWTLYGDATSTIAQAAAIVSRNRVRHPGFVPAQPLAVLTATGVAHV